VGVLVSTLRSVLSYPAVVSLLFWLFGIVLYPVAAIWAETRGNHWRGAWPFLKWVTLFTAAAAVIFLVTRYFGPG